MRARLAIGFVLALLCGVGARLVFGPHWWTGVITAVAAVAIIVACFLVPAPGGSRYELDLRDVSLQCLREHGLFVLLCTVALIALALGATGVIGFRPAIYLSLGAAAGILFSSIREQT